MRGRGGVKNRQNLAYVVYGWSRSWENAVDAVNAAFRSERATINGYTFLNNILPEDMKLILGEKKDSITNLFEKIMSQLKDAEEPEDFYAVDQNLLSEKKTKK